MYQRNTVDIIHSRMLERSRFMTIVAGPRQTGKTLAVRQALSRLGGAKPQRYIAVDQPSHDFPRPVAEPASMVPDAFPADPYQRDTAWLVRQWELARREADRSETGSVLVLDEIQKITNWSETVKGLWDSDRAEDRDLNVVLLGSSPLLMQRGLKESLAGRFELIRVAHWSFLEMYEAFDLGLEHYLYFGGYPGAAPLIAEEQRWQEYIRSGLIEPNIDKDILMMTRVDKPALLKHLFSLGCAYSGQILSYNKMLGQLQDAGNTTTLAHYLDLLSSAGLLTGLKKYAGHQHRRRASSPKLNVLNTGLMAALSGYDFRQAKADRTFWGRLTESAVGAHLYNTGQPDCALYYWRESPHEVDFILERGGRLVAIEVKSGASANRTPGLAAFAEHFKPGRTLMVGEGGVPLEEFLTQPAAYWLD